MLLLIVRDDILAFVRLWHGKVSIEKADKYERLLIVKAAPDYGSVDGLQKYISCEETKIQRHILSL